MPPPQTQQERDEEARRAAQEALRQLQGISLTPREEPGAAEPPAELADISVPPPSLSTPRASEVLGSPGSARPTPPAAPVRTPPREPAPETRALADIRVPPPAVRTPTQADVTAPPPRETEPVATPPATAAPSMGRALGSPRSPSPQPSSDGTSLAAAPAAEPESRRERLYRMLEERLAQRAPEHDYTAVDVADAIATPFRMIGRGLTAMSGRTPGPRQSWGAEERARNQAADAAARTAADRDLQTMGTLARFEGEDADRDARMRREELATALASRRAGIMERQAETSARNADTLAATREAEVRRLGRESDLETALSDPQSEQSEMARRALRQAVAGFPAEAQRRWADSLGVTSLDEAFEGLPGTESRRLMGELDSMFRDLMTRRRGPAGTGGGGGAGADSANALLREDARRAGIPEGAINTYMVQGPRGRRELADRIASAAGEIRRDTLNQQHRLAPTSEAAVRAAAAEDAVSQLAAAMPAEGEDVAGFGRLDSLRGRGWLQSEDGRRMRTLAENAVRRYLRLESGAAIGVDEMAQELELRGMGPGATEQQFRDGVRDLQRDLQVRLRTLRGEHDGPQPAAAGEPARPRARPQAPAPQQRVQLRVPGFDRPVVAPPGLTEEQAIRRARESFRDRGINVNAIQVWR